MTAIVEVRRGRLTGRVFETAQEVMARVEELHRERGCEGMASGVHTCLEVAGEEPARWYQPSEPAAKPVDDEPKSCGGQYNGIGFVDAAQQRHRARCLNHGLRLVETTVRHGPSERPARSLPTPRSSATSPCRPTWLRSSPGRCGGCREHDGP